MLILQASFDIIGLRAFYMVLERRFFKSVDHLLWRCREFVDSNIFGLYNLFRHVLDYCLFVWGGHFSILRQYSVVSIDDFAKIGFGS